ncbi:MAG TPA: MerR family transcriptional regulator [Nitrospiria bacterium]
MARKTFGPKEVCHRVGISSRQLNYWKLIGVVKPRRELHGTKVFHRYTEKDLEMIMAVKKLTEAGYMVSKAAEQIKAALARGEEISPRLFEELTASPGPVSAVAENGLTLPGNVFAVRLEEEVKRSHRFKHPLSCLILRLETNPAVRPRDLPKMIMNIEKLMMPLKRTFDVVTRTDDLEFTWLLCQTDAEGSSSVSERIQEQLLASELRLDGRLFRLLSEVGRSTLQAADDSGEALIKRAREQLRARRGEE